MAIVTEWVWPLIVVVLKDVLGFEVIGLNWLSDAVTGVSELVMVKVVQVAQVALVALLSEKFLGMSTRLSKDL